MRNVLSHYSATSVVRNRVNQTDFEEELRLTKKMLEACGIMTEETLLWSIINSWRYYRIVMGDLVRDCESFFCEYHFSLWASGIM